jgi:hypothetical protein
MAMNSFFQTVSLLIGSSCTMSIFLGLFWKRADLDGWEKEPRRRRLHLSRMTSTTIAWEEARRGWLGVGEKGESLVTDRVEHWAAHAHVNGRARELAEMADRANIKSLYFHLVAFPCMVSLSFPFGSRAALQL